MWPNDELHAHVILGMIRQAANTDIPLVISCTVISKSPVSDTKKSLSSQKKQGRPTYYGFVHGNKNEN